MQFGFMAGRGTVNALLETAAGKYSVKKMYIAFVIMRKAFDKVPRNFVWQIFRKLGLGEWLVKIVQSMYTSALSRVKVNGNFIDNFLAQG